MEAYLYSAAREVLTCIWGLRASTLEEAISRKALGATNNCFLDADGKAVLLIVTLMCKPWTCAHTLGAEKGLREASARAVIIVRGEVKGEALCMNLREDTVVHVMRDTTVLNLPAELPVIVQASSRLLQDLGVESSNELKKVKATAPEVELLKARAGDVIAYPPRSEDSVAPFGQENNWTARVVVE